MLEQTSVVILAGGLGTRLRSVLPDRPKGLAPIGLQAFLEIQLRLLRDQGARRFALCVGYQADQIQAALGDGRRWGITIEYSVETGPLLGTAGALKLAERFFDPHALVLNGDTYFAIDYAQFTAHHERVRKRWGALATLALARLPDHARYGNVTLTPDGEHILCFREKDATPDNGVTWVSGGAYMLEREALADITPSQPYSLERDVFPSLLARGSVLAAFASEKSFFDIGTPTGWQTFTDYYQELHGG